MREIFHGTREGEFIGIRLQVGGLTVEVIDNSRSSGGKLTAHWCVATRFGLIRQPGVFTAKHDSMARSLTIHSNGRGVSAPFIVNSGAFAVVSLAG